jgi:hypothetical protein
VFLPTFLIGLIAATWGITNVLAKVGVLDPKSKTVMKKNRTFNLVGMVVNALYVTLVKVVTAYFECSSNPSAEDTLTKYRYVECAGEEKGGGMLAMVYGMWFYVIGVFAIFAYGVRCFPAQKHLKEYRECWTFMLYRWRADCYYWGIIVMFRNLLVAFTGVFSSEPRSQLLMAIIFIMLCSLLTAAYHPWSEEVLNWYDMSTNFVLTLIALFGVVFLALQNEVIINTRQMMHKEADILDEELQTYAEVLIFLIIIFGIEFFALIVWCIQLLRPGKRNEVIKQEVDAKKALYSKLTSVVENKAWTQAVEGYLALSEEHDRNKFVNVLDKILDRAEPKKEGAQVAEA